MTLVGHGIFGATIAVVTIPLDARVRRLALAMLAFAALANIPDLHLPYWGHERYGISHSVFVNGAIILLFLIPFLLSRRARRSIGGITVAVGCALAWLSHLLLDTFYNHGRGLAMFWPFSKGRLALPVPWFETAKKPLPHFDLHTAKVWSIELVSYGVVIVAALLVRHALARHRGTGPRVDALDRH